MPQYFREFVSSLPLPLLMPPKPFLPPSLFLPPKPRPVEPERDLDFPDKPMFSSCAMSGWAEGGVEGV